MFGEIKNSLVGIPIIVLDDSLFIIGYKRMKKHKKSRIDKKWRKMYGYVPVYDFFKVLVFQNRIYCSKKIFESLKKSNDTTEDTEDEK